MLFNLGLALGLLTFTAFASSPETCENFGGEWELHCDNDYSDKTAYPLHIEQHGCKEIFFDKDWIVIGGPTMKSKAVEGKTVRAEWNWVGNTLFYWRWRDLGLDENDKPTSEGRSTEIKKVNDNEFTFTALLNTEGGAKACKAIRKK